MRYVSSRATNVTVNGSIIRIANNDLFGVREVRGSQTDEVMLQSGKTFRLAINKSEVLMNRGKEFKGKVKLKPEGAVEKTNKASTKLVPVKIATKQQQPAVKVKNVHKPINSPVRVKLSDIDLPEEDDFTDHELPHEFRKYNVSESADTKWILVIASQSELKDMIPGTLAEFNVIVRQSIEPHVKKAKHEVEAAIKEASNKVKAWAMIHLQQARKLGKNSELFEKLLNNPTAAVRQLAHSMLGAPMRTDEEVSQVEDILDGVTFN